jgi:predicted DNA-binding protein
VGDEMEDKKLEIRAKKYRGDSSVVSLRLPTELISTLDGISKETGRTRNEIMQTCLEFAVENLEIKS